MGTFSALPGWENSFIARTMLATWATPSSDCWAADGISLLRYARSVFWLKDSIAASMAGVTELAWIAVANFWHSASKPVKSANDSSTKRILSPIYWMGVL